MPKQVTSIDTIGDVDKGMLRIAFNQALKTISSDLADRPALKKKRKIILTLEFEPQIDKNSGQPDFEEADVDWHVALKVPSIGRQGLKMKPSQNGGLFFHSDLPEAPADETIMDEAERRQIERQERERRNDQK